MQEHGAHGPWLQRRMTVTTVKQFWFSLFCSSFVEALVLNIKIPIITTWCRSIARTHDRDDRDNDAEYV